MSRRTRLSKTTAKRRKRIVTYITVEREVVSAGPAYVAFGKIVRELRDKMGMTQEALAKEVGLGRPSISNIEASRQSVSLGDVLVFARALNIKPEKLVAMVVAEIAK